MRRRAFSTLSIVLAATAVHAARARESAEPDGGPLRVFDVESASAQPPNAGAGQDDEVDTAEPTDYRRPAPEARLEFMGYIDLGWANAGGDGTSFYPGDFRGPADYLVDTFAPMVNSRGEVASTDAGGRFTNGFLPRSVGIGGRPSFLVNNVTNDVRFTSAGQALLLFARAHLLPRFEADGRGNQTTLWLEQAFLRVIPFAAHELALFFGKFDSVFGIEYLDNQSNLRTGITPSLLARYSTGQSLGTKLFYRLQIPSLWSALSINLAATNSGNMIEVLQPPDLSLSGRPVLSGRLGYELNLPRIQIKLGHSRLHGPRNDQRNPNVIQRMAGYDVRIHLAGLSLQGECMHVAESTGTRSEKLTGTGTHGFSSGFWARGCWMQAAYRFALPYTWLNALTPYARIGERRAQFSGWNTIEVRRLTLGMRMDLGDNVVAKVEWLKNDELEGAPHVNNDIFTTSLVLSY